MATDIITEIVTTMDATESMGPNITTISSTSSASAIPANDFEISKVVTIVTLGLLTLAIIVNLIALAISIFDPRRQCSRANIWAGSFFTAQVLFSLNTMVSLYLHTFMDVTDFDKLITHGQLFVEFISRGAMVIALGGVVVDRYRAISDVKSYCGRRSLRTSCCWAVAGWLLAVSLAVPVLVGLTDYWYATYNSLRPFDIFTSIHTALVYVIPLVVFSVIYNGLMCRLISRSSRRSLDSYAATEATERHRASQRRLTAGIIATVVIFAFSWLPYLTVRVVAGYFPDADFQPLNTEEMRLVGNLVAYLGLAVCPVLVCVVCARYKSLEVGRLCSCCPDSPGIQKKSEKVWSSVKQNPYYLY
ncbi:neuropeptide CCHamide-1 receptor-like [Diadema antillarum]|uniref:neuropeptide CCHamide-1 receptor-like n=1 Tax=Diadema antillarum TaxID=105358 RepID=UPI003A860C70